MKSAAKQRPLEKAHTALLQLIAEKRRSVDVLSRILLDIDRWMDEDRRAQDKAFPEFKCSGYQL